MVLSRPVRRLDGASLFGSSLFEGHSYQLMAGTAALGLAGKPGQEIAPVSGDG
jgi:hypothetical protein